jgi:phosphoenolpyruvate carboxykinase (ATP)
MLKKKIRKHDVNVWLLNTGISGGPYGIGKRMPLPDTRKLVTAAIDGTLEKQNFVEIPVFGLSVPESCPGVKPEILQPRLAWDKKEDYDRKARELSDLFESEYRKHATD